jgi:ketosteroid isomerase-like protein
VRAIKAVVTIIALLLAPVGAAAAQRGIPDPERAAVQQLLVAMGQNIQSGNMSAVDSLFSSGGHILTDTTTLHAWTAYRDGQLKAELARFTNLKFEHTAVEAQVRGTVAWVAFRQQISGTTSAGALQLSGRGTAVLEKRNGRWVIVHLHVSR